MNKLQELRKAAGLTQAQLAAKANISISLLRKYEIEYIDIRKAKFATIKKLCEALDCEPDDII